MKKFQRIISIIFLLLSVTIYAQPSNSVVAEIDYVNALRYTGARNIARTPEGYTVVVYEPASKYINQEIWYAYYNQSFGSWDISQLSQSATGETGIPSVVADEVGNIHASWKERRSTDSGERNLMYSKLSFKDEFTYTWSTPERADTFALNNPGVNTIQLDDSNNPFILYSIWNDPAIYNSNIYSTKKINGVWSTDNLTVEFPTPGVLPITYLDVNLATGKDGEMFAAWEDKPTEIVNQWELLFSHYYPATGWTKPEIVSPIFDGVGIAKYVDGYTPVEGAIPVYNMGPESYQLAGNTTVIYNETETSKSIVASFNPYYIFPTDKQQQFLKDVINFFSVTNADSILLVDDDNLYNNEDVVKTAIESLGIPYRTFDCGNSAGMATNIPTFENDLNGKKLVIWFTGDESSNTAFWSVSDTPNEELKTYLNNAGSQLFILGRSWLYDVYGNAPDTLAPGDFAYDYLGISTYNVQSWTDDGNIGVPQLIKVDTTINVSSLETIGWNNLGVRQGVPSIATDPAYTLHMVFKDDSDGTIKYQYLKDGIWSESIRLDESADTAFVDRPVISIDQNYGIYVIWRQETAKVNGVSLYNVFYKTSPDGGLTWNNPVQLSSAKYVDASGYSTYRAKIGYKVRPEILGKFSGGADVVWVEASQTSSLGYYIMYGNIPYVGTITGVNDKGELPNKFELGQNYPNPFNPSTTIKYSIPSNIKSKISHTKLAIYDILGREIVTLVNKQQAPGSYEVNFEANNLTSGIYFYKLTSGAFVATKKLVLLK